MAEKTDITKLSKTELEEILQKQEKILQNRKLLDSLPDKGEKISKMVEKLKKLIAKKGQTDDLSSRFQRINISQKAKTAELDSDDDDDAINTDINMEENNTIHAASSSFKTTQDSQTEQVKGRNRKPDKWEYDSAVTYARRRHFEKAKLIPVEESIQIQKQQKEEYEALRAKQAAEKLMQYRNPASSQSSLTFSSQEAKSRYRDTVPEDEYKEGEEESEEDIRDQNDSGED